MLMAQAAWGQCLPVLPQGRPGPQTLHTHLSVSPWALAAPEWEEKGEVPGPAAAQETQESPESRDPTCCCKRETAGQSQASWPQAPPSPQARSAATLTPESKL